jgi:hypothetical protein
MLLETVEERKQIKEIEHDETSPGLYLHPRLLPFAANAASKNSANVVLDSNVTVGTTELPKGTYKVVWTGTDPNAQVTFTNGKLDQNRSGTYRRRTKRYGS